jgi:predicted AlkP superfamily pyrophosphatase or phosphodiesterase
VSEHGITDNGAARRSASNLQADTIFDDGWTGSWFITDWKPLLKFVSEAPTKTYTTNVFSALRRGWSRGRPQLTVVNTDLLDATAHKFGWNSPQALRRVHELEQAVLSFETFMKKKRVPFVIYVTADHGGLQKEHDDNDPCIRTVPWVTLNCKHYETPIQYTTDIREYLRGKYLSSSAVSSPML